MAAEHPGPSLSAAPSPSELDHLIGHAAHLLPSQGPITVFVHHNTLHAFEDLPFEKAVLAGSATYGCHPYLPEDTYRREMARGRIGLDDLSEVLIEDLGDHADALIGFMGTRYHLRLAMLEHPLRIGSDAELRWLIAETDALDRFRAETPEEARRHVIDATRRFVRDASREGSLRSDTETRGRDVLSSLLRQFRGSNLERWSDRTWESFTLHWLWRVCHIGAHAVKRADEERGASIRHRDLLVEAMGRDTDPLVHDFLVPFCAAFLDQGFAPWTLPDRDRGFFESFIDLYQDAWLAEPWLEGLPAELRRIRADGLTPSASIAESLDRLGMAGDEAGDFIARTLLALRGWAGMIRQMETNAEWAAHPAPAGTLREFLAVRLILDRLAVEHVAREAVPDLVGPGSLREALSREIGHRRRTSIDQRAYLVFQLAQVRGWGPVDLHRMTKDDWSRLVAEIESFDGPERRRVYQLAFERHYRTRALDAIAIHAASLAADEPGDDDAPGHRPSFQLITCIDDREESFRRHLEEIAPDCETFGTAGFFAVAMYYRGASDAHYRPLCPVVIRPSHYVRESAAYSLTGSSRQRAETRRLLGTATRQWHISSRSLLGGILTTMLGSLASIPMITRILFPRLTAQARRLIGTFVEPPPVTELQILRIADPPGPDDENLGYSYDEMCANVERVLRDIGLTRGFSRLIILAGHGSGSLNNPHESAYNCGACSGGRGGANARAFAQMANDPRVRDRLARNGLTIPDDTIFLGAYHNTCDEDVVFHDLDRLPRSHRGEFEEVRRLIDQARERNAHERSRRFESASLGLSPREALEHVETRAEDLSQARPEYNHATNALCLVGRRDWSRGLFLDRRAFLSSYDPTQDDADSTILARSLAAVIPVCAGISLEYYFSRVDEIGYGCGSKLPHNIASLLGVMEGASGDLRPGLSMQMTEIHEPVRILFVIETTPEAMLSIMDRNPTIGRLVRNDWVQMATLDPTSRAIHVFDRGSFRPYRPPPSAKLPAVGASIDWYRGRRDHLGFAAIAPAAPDQGEDR
jgi:uncharacterized protein YbcC (UPF0753/DUF2309 family)